MQIAALKRMSPQARLLKAFELSRLADELFLHGLRRRFPQMADEAIRQLYRERIAKCYNRNC
ncbi:MAG: hypothetical protein RDU89_10330 [bacterium]|jgi:hypothetical protein|nr:hypothetical protein [bacterium]